MSLYQRVLGHPFVYDHVRPLAVGGIDMSPFYARIAAGPDDTIVDVGCGTGDALRYLHEFKEYVGFDTDGIAIDSARKKHGSRANTSFVAAPCTAADFERLAPTRVALCGLLHHLTDDEVLGLLRGLQRSGRLRRVVTSDIVFLDGELVSNFYARMDRGKYCRVQEGYFALVRESGLKLVESTIVRCHPTRGLAKYLLMTLEPTPAA
jgi:SAM-dependent methyltransferase